MKMKAMSLFAVGFLISMSVFAQADSVKHDMVDDPIAYIKRESIGGKLDFNLVLAKENKNGFYVHDGIGYNRKDFAIFLWGQKVMRLGISSSKKAVKLWEEINGRDMTAPEKKALLKGFKKVIE
jgi:hypothetical protein